jgi:hypothetical protein
MNDHENADARDTLLLAGGAALMIFGAGMLMASPAIRKSALGSLFSLLPGQHKIAGTYGGLLPDVERYMKLKSM